jgi:hypothetical protein
MSESAPQPLNLPWEVVIDGNGIGMRDAAGEVFASVYGLGRAQRIIACVNACKDISTKDLEEAPPGTLMDIISQLYSVCDSWERLRGFFKRESK